MVQNHLSIDFRHTVRELNTYQFGYYIERSIEVATSIVLQHYDGKKSLPAWYAKDDKRLYADSINGYWEVDGFTLAFVPSVNPIGNLENRVSILEDEVTQAQSDIETLDGSVTDLETTVANINNTLYVQSSDIASLKTRTTAVENKANANETNISSLSNRMATAESDISANASEITSLKSRVTTAEGGVANNASDIASLKTRTTAVENKSNANETNISSLSNRMATAETDISTIKTVLNGAVLYRGVTGNNISITNGYPGYLQDCIVTITPTQSGSGDPSPDNIRPFVGYDSVTIERYGRNLWPYGDTRTFTRYTGGDSNVILSSPFPAGTYTLSAFVTSNATNVTLSTARVYSSLTPERTIAVLDFNREVRESHSFTANQPIAAIVLYAGTNYNSSGNNTATWSNIQLESGSVATEYQPHNFYSVSMGQAGTVYGGILDVTIGELTVTWGNIASYNGETLPGVWMSDRDVYVAGTTPTTGAQVVYELETPLVYQIDRTNIRLYEGVNHLHSTGDSLRILYPSITAIS